MHIPPAFSHPCKLHTSPETAKFAGCSRNWCSTRRRQRRWAPTVAAARPPPKAGYYKNPSRAIEKGGGFYVPGLQGPRLRFFVPVISTALLALNHAAAGASTDALTRSEVLGAIAAVAIAGTAILDTMKEGKRTSDEGKKQISRSTSAPQEVRAGTMTGSQSDRRKWATAVVRDLTPGIEIALFRNNQAIFSTRNVGESTAAGVVVERVGKEQRPLYIARSSSLPEEVTIPFLEDGDWSVFMIPTRAEDVVVFASREELSRDSRRWLEILSERIAEGECLQ